MSTEDKLDRPGDVRIDSLRIVSKTGEKAVELEDFMVELNIFEDIFSPSVTGQLVMSDSRNLIGTLPIIGEETLEIKLTTPTFPSSIAKVFRVTGVTDKMVTGAQAAQAYILHFCSQEAVTDMTTLVYKSFEGKIDEVVSEIFDDYIGAKLDVLTQTKNKVKFVSPGWTPFRCLNWLASKSLPVDGKSCNFMFWETHKKYYWGSLETIFKNGAIVDTYTYKPNNVRTTAERDIAREMLITDKVDTVKSIDHVKNHTSGYLANQLVELDLMGKKYEKIDYIHVDKFNEYTHMEPGSRPFFDTNTVKNAASNIRYYPKHMKLFDDFEENVNEVYRDIHGNRLSHMLELDNFKLNISVPGRTDIEVGQMIELKYPKIEPKDNTDKYADGLDKNYSGRYLITGIRHQVNVARHKMILELTKDGWGS